MNAEKPHRELPHGDFEVRPTSAWNYGVVMNGAIAKGLTFTERPMGDQPFSPEGAGMSATVAAKKITSWRLQHGWAGEVSVPDGDTADKGRVVTNQPEETMTLIPYGCTNIRITEFPKV